MVWIYRLHVRGSDEGILRKILYFLRWSRVLWGCNLDTMDEGGPEQAWIWVGLVEIPTNSTPPPFVSEMKGDIERFRRRAGYHKRGSVQRGLHLGRVREDVGRVVYQRHLRPQAPGRKRTKLSWF